ncbi:hypothetical protein [Streptomyces sp. NPDC057966]|uniref:hypothetical protein n=1 Tax=Streptomyces sp. NPDC057966 TaxID=3346292 RepID=UPI0036E14F66
MVGETRSVAERWEPIWRTLLLGPSVVQDQAPSLRMARLGGTRTEAGALREAL